MIFLSSLRANRARHDDSDNINLSVQLLQVCNHVCVCLFFQMKSTEADQGLFTDSYCKVCSAQLISESQRVAHYEVKTPQNITSPESDTLRDSCAVHKISDGTVLATESPEYLV